MSLPKQQLCKRIQERDPQALEELYMENERALFAFVFRILKNQKEAEDIIQDLFKSLWEEAPFIHDLTTRQWLFKHARIKTIKKLKQQLRVVPEVARVLSS